MVNEIVSVEFIIMPPFEAFIFMGTKVVPSVFKTASFDLTKF